MARHLVEWFLCLLSVIPPTLLQDSHYSRYGSQLKSITREIKLENVCRGTDKVTINIQHGSASATVFTFTGATASSQFQCHLELEVNSKSYGIGVFFEHMNLAGRWPSHCSGDHVQFGRDDLFVTTHTSRMFCGHVEAPVPKSQDPGLNKGLSFPQTKLTDKNRLYVESVDHEMDVWLTVQNRNLPKNLTLVVTPFKKSCRYGDTISWRKCQKYSRQSVCVKRDLFCDGRVNCPVRETEATDEMAIDCEALNVNTLEGHNIPKVALVIVILALMGIVLFILYTLGRKFGVCNKSRSHVDSQVRPSRANSRGRESTRERQVSVVRSIPVQGRDSNPETIPMSELPLHPPPYSEVVGYPQEDPPKYSDIMNQSRDILGR